MTPKISVIVPMYNSEKYIGMCIQSILYQTFKDFELILVDDCSTDKTLEIAKSFKDKRINILKTKENFGMPAPVRNIGLERACGKYIYFMDSDDVIIPNAFEILLNIANKSKADVVVNISYFEPEDDEFKTLKDTKFKIKTWGTLSKTPADLKIRLLNEWQAHGDSCLIWQKIYSHDFLKNNDIKFREIHCEDEMFLIEILCSTDRIVKFNHPFYIYRRRKNTESHHIKNDLNKFRHRVKNLIKVADVLENILPRIIKRRVGEGNDINILINQVSMAFMKMYFDAHILPFVNFSSNNTINIVNIVDETLNNEIFGKSTMFIKTLICNYLFDNAKIKIILQNNNYLMNQIREIHEKTDKLLK